MTAAGTQKRTGPEVSRHLVYGAAGTRGTAERGKRHMVSAALEAILPGLRDVRRPLAAGVLWVAFGWLLVADHIPPDGEGPAILDQVRAAPDALGITTTLVVASLAIYVVGLLGVTVGDSTARAAAALQRQRKARAGLSQFKQDRLDGEASDRDAADDKERERAQERLSRVDKQLAKVRVNRLGWITSSPQADEVLRVSIEPGANSPFRDMARTVAGSAWDDGFADQLAHVGAGPLDEDAPVGTDEVNAYGIERDLGPDPVEGLRALDAGLFQDFDRERAEREFLIATMPAVVALSIVLAFQFALVALIGAALALVTFWRATTGRIDERERVIRAVLLAGLPLPTIQKARSDGRRAAINRLDRQYPSAKSSLPPSENRSGSEATGH